MKLKISSLNKKSLFLFVVITFLLQLSFNYNFFNATSKNLFNEYQKSSEALVIGKIINSQNNSLFSKNVMGTYGEWKNNYNIYLYDDKNNIDYIIYSSSFGLQGYFYSILDRLFNIFNFSSHNKLNFMYFLTSFALSLTFATFIISIKKEFGLFSSFILFVTILYCQPLVIFSKNLYWVTFLLFLPFVYSWYILKKYENITTQNLPNKFYLCIFLLIYFKCLSGFEFLSTIFISIAIPFIYFYLKNNWEIQTLLKKLTIVYFYSFSAFILSIFTFLLQKYFVYGNIDSAINLLKFIVLKRTHGNSEEMPYILKASLESDIFEVLLKYWNNKNSFDFNSIFGYSKFITFGDIFLLFIIFIIIYIALSFFIKLNIKYKKEQKNLLIVTFISFLAPLSWFVLSKGHSYIHSNINYILLYVPSLLLVFTFISLTIRNLLSLFFLFTKFILNILISNIIKTLSLILVVIVIYFTYSNYKKNVNLELLNSNIITLDGIDNNMTIFFNTKEQKIIYFYKDCKNKDVSTGFFLHLIPEDTNNLPENRKQYKFDNLDFNWNSHAIETPFFGEYRNSCLAVRDLPKYKIKTINTGQFNKDGRLWQTSIDLTSKIEPLKDIQSFNLTDNNWINGISLSKSGFFVENNFLNRQSLKIGDIVEFNSSGKRNITNLTYSSKYINIFVDGEKLDPIKDGYPNKIKLIKEPSK